MTRIALFGLGVVLAIHGLLWMRFPMIMSTLESNVFTKVGIAEVIGAILVGTHALNVLKRSRSISQFKYELAVTVGFISGIVIALLGAEQVLPFAPIKVLAQPTHDNYVMLQTLFASFGCLAGLGSICFYRYPLPQRKCTTSKRGRRRAF